MDRAKRQALERFIAAAAYAESAAISEVTLLVGGAVQENWLLDIDVVAGARARPPGIRTEL